MNTEESLEQPPALPQVETCATSSGPLAAIQQLSQDWADDHSAVQRLAKRVGVPANSVDGDSYGVPGIMDLIQMIEDKLCPRCHRYSDMPFHTCVKKEMNP